MNDRDQAVPRTGLVLPGRSIAPRELLDAAEAQVVPRIRVLGPRIAEPNDQPRLMRVKPRQRISRRPLKQPPQDCPHPFKGRSRLAISTAERPRELRGPRRARGLARRAGLAASTDRG